MAKTYTAAGSATAGDVYTASAHNVIVTDVNNLIVPPLLRVSRATTQSLANNTDVYITWPVEDFDTDGCYTPTSDTITIQTAGIYLVNLNVVFAGNTAGNRVITIQKNPSSVGDIAARIASAHSVPTSTATLETILSCSATASFAVNDTIKAAAYQTSGGALNIGSTTWTAGTNLSVSWIGRTS